MRTIRHLAILGLAITVAGARANNIRVGNVVLRDQDTADAHVTVQFDVGWENSWRNTLNHDAAWVFIKFRAPGSNHWQHACLLTDAAEHAAPNAVIEVGTSMIDGTDHGMGAFVYSAAMQTGTVQYARTRLRWDYGASGYTFAKGEEVDVAVHAIEMVYVAEGPFHVGSGGTESGSFTDGGWESGNTLPFEIAGEGALPISDDPGSLWGTASGDWDTIGSPGMLPEAYPKGFRAFYSMKYYLTQGQYTEFLNHLTFAQQNTRTPNSPADSAGTYLRNATRHVIRILSPGVSPDRPAVYATEYPYIACNYLTSLDGSAYADWAGLRPMTELEFEKAARGPAQPVPNEYAWGTASLASTGDEANYLDLGLATERATQGNAVYSGSHPGGPVRAGIFATEASSREAAGASYWGIMELSGNLWEPVISAGLSAGRSFTGVHGDGELAANGNANTGWSGFGNRGGAYTRGSADIRVSSRARASTTAAGTAYLDVGFRAVRTAPGE